jgi:TRAP transporter 4TM/12TM fusion protein
LSQFGRAGAAGRRPASLAVFARMLTWGRGASVIRVDLSHGGLVRVAVTVVAVAMVLYHMWVIVAGASEAIIFRGTHLLFALVLVFLIFGSKVGVQRPIPNFIDYAWLALGVTSLLYLFINYEYIVTRIYYIDTGVGQLFMDFAMALTGHTAGGPGKVSVVSSSLFGTISGSAVANVMVDGPISIPLMKRSGFPPHFAAGVEATASTGGQMMPPIMGAAAFVMAEFLAVPYSQIVIWAVIPAILYYVACFAAVHFEAKCRGIVGVPRSELPRLRVVMAERGHLFLPILILLVVMYSGYSAPLAALAGVLACFPVAALRKSTRVNVTLPIIIEAMVDGSKNALAVALACACAGIMIGVVTLSGLGIVFTQWVVGLAQDTLFVALIMTMLAAIVLGTGLPTTPSYILLTALLIPAIMKLGVIEPAAHMFAFYYSILSAITPPVALAVFAAAGLAKADMWSSCWAAMKIGAAGFIIPFMFVYQPALLMIGRWPEIIWAFGTSCVGIALFAGGLHGYFVTAASYWQRVLLTTSGIFLVFPGVWTDLTGAALAAIVIVTQVMDRRAATQSVKQSEADRPRA